MLSIDDLYIDLYPMINSQDNHLLYRFCAAPYYIEFWNMVESLVNNNGFDTKAKVQNFKRQMQLKGEFDLAKYLEGASEVIFQYYAIRKGLSHNLEKRINRDNGTDVDIQICDGGFIYNIEIKTPKYEMTHNDNTTLNVNLSHRTMSKADVEKEKGIIEKELINPIIESKTNTFEKIRYTKIEDNKLLSFLRSAQEKFTYSDEKSINLLVVAIPSSKMQDYWGYLYNSHSGVFTPNYDEELIGISKNEFDKVDNILLTNLVSGHIHTVDKYNSWHLENYCNILCRNPNNKRKTSNQDKYYEAYKKLQDLLPNDNNRFERLYVNYNNNMHMAMECIFSEFLANNYSWLWWND